MKLKDVYQQIEGKQDLDMRSLQSEDSVREGSRYDRLVKENKQASLEVTVCQYLAYSPPPQPGKSALDQLFDIGPKSVDVETQCSQPFQPEDMFPADPQIPSADLFSTVSNPVGLPQASEFDTFKSVKITPPDL